MTPNTNSNVTVTKFSLKTAVNNFTDGYNVHVPKEIKNIISYYQYINKDFLYFHCEKLLAYNTGENMGFQPTVDHVSPSNDAVNRVIISHKSLRSEILSLWIRN